MTSNLIEASSGFVLLGDIAKFSGRSNDVQRELVLHLWTFLNSRKDLAPGSGNQAILNGTGDGAIIVFPRNSSPDRNQGRVIQWKDVVDLAVEWSDWMRRPVNGEPVDKHRLRIGIHQGQFQCVDVEHLGGLAQHGGMQIVGVAPNMCSRVAGFGGAGDIMFSEDFVRSWKDGAGVGEYATLPAGDEAATRVYVKHGYPLDIRRLDRGLPEPEKLRSAALVREQLLAALVEATRIFMQHLMAARNQSFSSASEDQERIVSPRTSLWVVGAGGDSMVCHDCRWHARGHGVGPTRTRYLLANNGHGPVGRAYCSRQPFVLNKGPAASKADSKSVAKYAQWLFKRASLEMDVGMQVTRFARSFFSLPIGLNASVVDAVLCIDCEDELADLQPQVMKQIAKVVGKSVNQSMSALLRLDRH